MRLPEDEEECVLIRAARQGNREAFDLLLQAQLPTLYRFLAGRLGGRDAIEDIVQETLLGAWTALPHFEPRVRFRTWLLRIAANKTADYLRCAIRRDRYEQPLESENILISSENLEAATERRGMIRQALSQLSGPQREVIEMYYYAELTLPEISRLTGRNLNTVKYQFYAAHAAAAATLKEESDDYSTNIGAASPGTDRRPGVRTERLVSPAVTCMVSPKTIRKAGQ
jgi:RNA polymerase sigma-70 factor (ECF subfamily)